jgi:3'-5' exoribonuclease
MPRLNLLQLDIGDRVQHELRVVDRMERSKPGGEPFVILTLGNASGQIDTEPIWSNQLASGWADGVDRGTIVQVIGNVGRYEAKGQSKRQIKLTQPLRLIPHDSVDIEDFLPRIDEPPAKYWDYIDRVRREMRSETLRRVLGLFFEDDAFRLRFERTPGSISRHHAKLGGLLLHVTEVTTIARTTAKSSRANVDLVTVGALLHDVGKVEAYEIAPTGFAYTPCGHLLGHVVLGCLMLERRLAAAGMPVCTDIQTLELQHLILSHHGSLEFGSPVEPMTLEAEIVHWADEASAKVADFGDAVSDRDGFPDGEEFSRRLWRVNRRVWRPTHRWE